jgi:hypothetical protein
MIDYDAIHKNNTLFETFRKMAVADSGKADEYNVTGADIIQYLKSKKYEPKTTIEAVNGKTHTVKDGGWFLREGNVTIKF